MKIFEFERIIKTREETFGIEPALKNANFKIYDSYYSEDDESENAKIFTEQIKDICIKIRVKFYFSNEALNIN